MTSQPQHITSSGKDIFALLGPIYNSTSHQIRQHFLDPSVLMVFAGCHPATKVVVANPSQEIFHELRTINLLLSKKRIRMRISTKHLRKEINNLQRQASIIIESLDGFEKLSKSIFSSDAQLKHIKSFAELENWKKKRVLLNKSTEKPLFDSIDEGEVGMEKLNLIAEEDKDKILLDFLHLSGDKDSTNDSKDQKFFNLLERLNKTMHHSDMSFDELMSDLRIVVKNSHLLIYGLLDHSLSSTATETLKEMLESKYSLVQKIARKALGENITKLKERVEIHKKFPADALENDIHLATLKKIQLA